MNLAQAFFQPGDEPADQADRMGESLRVAQEEIEKIGGNEGGGRHKTKTAICLMGRRFTQIDADKTLLGQKNHKERSQVMITPTLPSLIKGEGERSSWF